MVAAAIIGSAVVGAGASVAASKSAAKSTQKATDKAIAAQENNYQRNAAILAPYVATGNKATGALEALLGLSPGGAAAQEQAFENWRNASGYQFTQAEGQKAINAALGRSGQLESGAAVKSALRFNTGLASNTFGQYQAALQGQQQAGLAAAGAQAGVGTNTASNTSALYMNQGDTDARVALATGSAINKALGDATSALTWNQGLKSSYGAAKFGIGG